MHAILLAWKNSLDLLRPHRLATLGASSFKILVKTILSFGRSFLPFLLCDAALFFVFGDHITKIMQNPMNNRAGILLFIIVFAQSIAWFLASTAFFLLMRREEPLPDYPYYASFILKYCQLTLTCTMVLYLGTAILISNGITTVPPMNWYILAALKALALLVVFYWLEAPVSFKHMFGAIEHGINCFIYNFPIMMVLLLLACGLDFGLSHGLSKVLEIPVDHVLFTNTHILLATLTSSGKGRLIVLAVKYGIFIFEAILAVLMLGIYRRKRHEQYSDSLFL